MRLFAERVNHEPDFSIACLKQVAGSFGFAFLRSAGS